jgi:hypothetical protein
MKIFGKSLFEKKATPKLYDFAQHGLLRMDLSGNPYTVDIPIFAVGPGETAPGKKAKKKAAEKEVPMVTPKEIFNMKTLNKPKFAINCEKVYLDGEIETLKEKLDVLGKSPKNKKRTDFVAFESGAAKYGRFEVESMIERLGNRKVYSDFQECYDEWPYTTSDALREMLAQHKKLEAIVASEMIPDLPKEAITAIKSYTKNTEKLCGKQPIFYLIREKEEEKSVMRKRDPILLAQSPFGFFWQILGAWDKEVVLLEEL